MDTVKILLTSDIHLGIERENPLISRDERFNTFRKIASLAAEHDILLLAGDIFHAGLIDKSYFNDINNELAEIAEKGTEIFFAPGSGETELQGPVSGGIHELKTTFTFSEKSKEPVFKSGKGDICIYGIPAVNSPLYQEITRKDKNGFHLGLFYGEFSPQSTEKGEAHFIGKKEIKQMNLDFFALGRNHWFRLFRFSERILGAYPGSPEPCSLDECGERFVISLEIEGDRIASFKRIPVNTVTVYSHEIDCSSLSDEKELIKAVKGKGSRDTMNRIELCGTRNFTIGLALSEELTGHFRGLKIIDMTDLPQKIFMDESSSGRGFKGMFFRNLSESVKINPHCNPDYMLIKELLSGSAKETGGIIFCDS
jgi:DNA repair exonuclease SbcCD nuclease subunit